MGKSFLLSIYFFFALSFTYAQNKAKKAISEVLNQQENAWNNGNIDAFMQGYWQSDSLIFIGKSDPSYGWQTALDNYKKGYPDNLSMGILHFDILQMKSLSPTHYFIIGKWHLKRKQGDVGGIFTLLFQRIKGKWLIIADHTS